MSARAPLLAALCLAAAAGGVGAARSSEPAVRRDAEGEAAASLLLDRFGALDENLDGRIDVAELAKAARAGAADPEALRRLFVAADADADGAIDRGEAEELSGFVGGQALLLESVEEQAASEAEGHGIGLGTPSDDDADAAVASLFRALDEGQGGRVGREAVLRAAAGEDDPSLQAVAQELFAEADSDADDALDPREAERFLRLLDAHLGGATTGAAAQAGLREKTEDDDETQEESGAEVQEREKDGEAEKGPGSDDAAELFRRLDMDQDGRLERHEIVAVDHDDPSFRAVAERLFAFADADADDALGRREAGTFLALLREYMSGVPPAAVRKPGVAAAAAPPLPADAEPDARPAAAMEEQAVEPMRADLLAQLFRGLDENQDARIDAAELTGAAQHIGDPSLSALVDRCLASADVDRDGALDAQEAGRFMGLLDERARGAGLSVRGAGAALAVERAAAEAPTEALVEAHGEIRLHRAEDAPASEIEPEP